jgi:hypothetical protein
MQDSYVQWSAPICVFDINIHTIAASATCFDPDPDPDPNRQNGIEQHEVSSHHGNMQRCLEP